jgi:hypothetical protein
MQTERPKSRAATDRLMHSVLLPLPPFCVTKAMVRMPPVLERAATPGSVDPQTLDAVLQGCGRIVNPPLNGNL